MEISFGTVTLVIFIVALVFVFKTINVVPQQHAWVVERLGKYHATLAPGLNIVIPFIDRVAYKHVLKEIPLDVPSQVCITRDNTQLQVDGILYFQVTDAMRASYGSSNYVIAITQLCQTTPRSVKLGRGGVALRDQGPDATGRDPALDAGADHRRAREARADRGVRRAA